MPLSNYNTLLAGLICIVYLCIGPGLILLNQHILKALNFPFPMFLSGLGVLASGVLAQIVVKLGLVNLERQESVQGVLEDTSSLFILRLTTLIHHYYALIGVLWFKRVLPVGLAHAATLAFGNAVYLYLNVGFIQMLKSFTPVIIMLTGIQYTVDVSFVAVFS